MSSNTSCPDVKIVSVDVETCAWNVPGRWAGRRRRPCRLAMSYTVTPSAAAAGTAPKARP